jgi:lipopolysaccharide export system protein LptA
VIELDADRQEFDQFQQVFTAEGRAVMRFRRSVLAADRIQVNLPNRIAVAEGNVSLTRGQQVLQGNRFEYNFVQGEGSIFGAGGQINVPAAAGDLATTLPSDIDTGVNPTQSVGSQAIINQPLQVQGSSGGITIGISGGNRANRQALGGQVNRLRYQADRIDFSPDGWVGTNVRITNDPFSPPELEVRSRRVTFRQITTTASELRASNPRVVFDQGFSLPLFRNRIVFDSRKRQPGLVQFGFDQRDRGGFFIERPFEVLNTPALSLTVTPQILLQRAYDNGFDFADGSAYGLRAQLSATISPTTTLTGDFVTTSLNFGKLEDNLRASLRAQQQFGRYTLAAEYIYRDRLFNGSLGFQNVQSSVGFVLTSPNIPLGNTGINFSFQGGIQFITANTDRADLQNANNRASLTRYQASAALSRGFYLWTGKALPPTATQGLRYTPNPILPYVALSTGVRGVYSAYSSGDTQTSLQGTVTLSGQFGHFSKNFLDYTAFRLSYSNTALDGSSPFLFDRVADEQTVSLGFTQQIYGPIAFGIQTSINLGTSRTIDTVYTLEYSRRTYTIDLSYSPVRQSAALTFRISDFNWLGDPGRFSGLGAGSVRDGVQPAGQ